MGSVNHFKLVVLTALLAGAALIVHSRLATSIKLEPKPPLAVALGQLNGWTVHGNQSLDASVVSLLKLDDYLFRTYLKNSKDISLYIGYYRTAKKVGAAHDPLVCFQGQGWKIGDRSTGSFLLKTTPGITVSYSSMVVQRPGEKELIVYWFQTSGISSSNTLSQKIEMVKSRLFGRSEDNAFVRISTTIGVSSPDAARMRVFDFIEAFYPGFNRYAARSSGQESL
jgi:EpsI family protein